MNSLLDHKGRPMSMNKGDVPVVKKNGFGQWAGQDNRFAHLPGGGVVQFDLTKLSLTDFRGMRYHYQVGSSINVLGFILHQIDWAVEGDNPEVVGVVETEINRIWTLLIRGFAQAFWAGYSPMAVNYKNGDSGYVEIDSIKDLRPEDCRVNWKETEGWAPPGKNPPKLSNYDGFTQNGYLLNTANTLWYPLLMENGDYYGRKLLANAFPAWYFSNLMHLFANRYMERYGEPLPIGRAPLNEDIDYGSGKTVSAQKAMEGIVSTIRSRAAVVLPSQRDQDSGEFDYSIEYLESQMRGADFERYMNRLDEEMSLAVFTPILLFRTADVGSYNLGQAHLRIFQQMLNAIAGDMKFFIDHYLVKRLQAINFPGDTSRIEWKFRQQGQGDIDTYKEVMSEMIRQERGIPDLEELSAITGITWTEAKQLMDDPVQEEIQNDDRSTASALAIIENAATRTASQYANGNGQVQLSHSAKFETALVKAGYGDNEVTKIASALYRDANEWIGVAFESGIEAKLMAKGVVNLAKLALADA